MNATRTFATAAALTVLAAACEPMPGTAGADGGSSVVSSGPCVPEGVYSMGKTAWTPGGGAFCRSLATTLNGQAKVQTIVIAKLTDTSYQTDDPDTTTDTPTAYTLESSTCELSDTDDTQIDSVDPTGKPVRVRLVGLNRARFPSGNLSVASHVDVTSLTPGASGFPCTLDATQSGVKR